MCMEWGRWLQGLSFSAARFTNNGHFPKNNVVNSHVLRRTLVSTMSLKLLLLLLGLINGLTRRFSVYTISHYQNF